MEFAQQQIIEKAVEMFNVVVFFSFLCILLVHDPTSLLALIFLSCITKGFTYVLR